MSIIYLDFAVVANDVVTQLIKQDPTSQYVVELDVIDISENVFKRIFFQDITNAFYVNSIANTDPTLQSFISFKDRKVLGSHFCLFDEILKNYCKDAQVSEDSFTPCSLIGLHKQINAIKNLYNVYQNRTSLCFLNWDEIVDAVRCENDDKSKFANVILTFTASFIPASVNTINFLPNTIKFNYKTTVTFSK